MISTPAIPISFTERALRRTEMLLAQESAPLALRIFVISGGCPGFQYGFALDEEGGEDFFFRVREVKVVVDPQSAPYLVGAEIDYLEEGAEHGFRIFNPEASKSCVDLHPVEAVDQAGAVTRSPLLSYQLWALP